MSNPDKKKPVSIEQAMAEALASVERIERESSGEQEGVDLDIGAETENHAAELKKLREEIDALRRQSDEAQEKMLRVAAEYDNYRKRMIKERSEIMKYAGEGLLRELLPSLDNLKRALQFAPSGDESKEFVKGIVMVSRMVHEAIARFGAEGFESKGKPFNPERHEALQHVFSADVPAGAIIEEMESGYLFKDRLLRPAKVLVSRGPAPAPKPADPPVAEAPPAAEHRPSGGADSVESPGKPASGSMAAGPARPATAPAQEVEQTVAAPEPAAEGKPAAEAAAGSGMENPGGENGPKAPWEEAPGVSEIARSGGAGESGGDGDGADSETSTKDAK
ncbi:MAG: Protein GrpE [Myxococcota bacterium]|nr:Protein GrpE [Myxococcota bacterium]